MLNRKRIRQTLLFFGAAVTCLSTVLFGASTYRKVCKLHELHTADGRVLITQVLGCSDWEACYVDEAHIIAVALACEVFVFRIDSTLTSQMLEDITELPVGCLNVQNCELPNDWGTRLRRATRLKSLLISGMEIEPKDLEALSLNPNIERIELLDQIHLTSDAHIDAIAQCTKLKTVSLFGYEITDAGAATLSKLKALENVSLTDVTVTDAGLLKLASLPRLKYLHVVSKAITAGGMRTARSATSAEVW